MALSLAVLFARQFPSLGNEAAALTFGVVILNEMVCPVLYRFVLVRSGEAFRKVDSDAQPIPTLEETPAEATEGRALEPA